MYYYFIRIRTSTHIVQAYSFQDACQKLGVDYYDVELLKIERC